MNEPAALAQIAAGVTAADLSVGALVADLLRRLSQHASTDARAASAIVQRHPLGFLACRWQLGPERTLRVHIWDRNFAWVQHPNWQIHDHVFSFKSLILTGNVLNKFYSIDDSERRTKKWQLYAVKYDQNTSTMKEVGGLVGLRVESCQLHSQGSAYEVKAGILHRSAPKSDIAVTVLVTLAQSTPAGAPLVVGVPQEHQVSYDRSVSADHDLAIILRSAALRMQAR